MNWTYIIYVDNIYYLDENNLIFSIEGYHGTVREGFSKNINFVNPVLDLQNKTFIESATPEEITQFKTNELLNELVETCIYLTDRALISSVNKEGGEKYLQ